MAREKEECCNPLAKSDLERCGDCPMRSKPAVGQPANVTKPAPLEKPKPAPRAAPRKVPDWQATVDELPES